jgi:predicted Zn-dependent protease
MPTLVPVVIRCAVALAATGATLSLAGCARNPVTGQSELALVSESQEIEMGRQAAAEAAQSLGLVRDDALQQYVHRIGAELAANSERPDLPWTFRVVDDPTPNAFALPGGFIFVTRGMLGLMQNEAELATVLGHEIGHVTARHSVQQISRQQIAQLGLGIGMILAPELARYGDLAGTGLQLLFLKYGRDAERQADELGFRYALNDNYDVREMADVFQSLQRIGEGANRSALPAWLSTHPYPEERIQAVQARLARLERPLEGLTVDAAEYSQRIDGLTYGTNPRDGFFEGSTFYHPDLRFRLTFPSGWQLQNLPQAVVGVSGQQDAAIQLTLAQGSDPAAAARQFLGQQGIQPGQAVRDVINGIPTVASYFQAQTEQGVIQGLVGFFSYGQATYQVLAYSPAGRFGAYDALFRQVIGSFAPVSDARILGVQPRRIDIVRLAQPMSLAEFNQRYPSVIAIEELALINQVQSASATLPAGTTVKRVVAGTGG